jgi:hypothetical protein
VRRSPEERAQVQERNTMRIAYCANKLLLRLALAGKVWTALAIQGNANADALQRVAKKLKVKQLN